MCKLICEIKYDILKSVTIAHRFIIFIFLKSNKSLFNSKVHIERCKIVIGLWCLLGECRTENVAIVIDAKLQTASDTTSAFKTGTDIADR